MGGGEKSNLPKSSKRNPSSQDTPTASTYPDWPGSMQAYYGGGATPFFAGNVATPTPHPYVWGTQHPFMSPYVTPVPYPALYPPTGVYTHPNIATAPHAMPTNIEIEGRAPNGKDRTLSKKLKETMDAGKAGSGSGNDGAIQSGDSRSEGSSDTSGNDDNQENTQASVPSNPIVSMPGNNLNMGMDLWNENSSGDGKANMRPKMVGRENATTNQWNHNLQDDCELKREKRKQSNRESARRSRLRKQAECEELQAKVEKLTNENQTLRNELQRLSEKCQKIASENRSIKEELNEVS